MVHLIREIDAVHPVSCRLHAPSLFKDNGLRVSDVFAEVDVPVMHGYPMYVERFFGLVRPDGSLKPHVAVLKRFAATAPYVQPAQRPVVLDVSPEVYYRVPFARAKRLYQAFRR
jgi:hypothetical protein